MSSYDSLVNERQTGLKSTFLDKMLRSYEKSILRHADIVLTDTLLHRDYFSQLFDMPRDKIVPIPVSADESVFFPVPAQTSPSTGQRFHVLFYGSLLPLHGVEFHSRCGAKSLRPPSDIHVDRRRKKGCQKDRGNKEAPALDERHSREMGGF